ncbi:MAG: hypothetical protein IKP06_05865 [Elusimicrobiaceae bacterium]|nr:hypothetical protein [Elusimicrobiaceae bacterium]
MKKVLGTAILILITAACYTPLNNSGVATTKPWLEIYGKKMDFEGKQYDSCYQFNVHFWPQEAAQAIDLQESCISACCWRSDKEEVILDFNRNFEEDLAAYGQAYKYTPGKITLKVNHANWLNTTRVTVSPKSAIRNNGLIKLKYKKYENPTRMAQVQEEAREAAVHRNADELDERQRQELESFAQHKAIPQRTPKASSASIPKLTDPTRLLVQRQAGAKIDNYFYQMNKRYTKQGATFLLSERFLYSQPVDENTAIVSCQAKARTGLDGSGLNASTFSCGQWLVDIKTQTVTPYDNRAKLIWNE